MPTSEPGPLGYASPATQPPRGVHRFAALPSDGRLVPAAAVAAGVTFYAWSWLELDPVVVLAALAAWVAVGGVWVYRAGVARTADPPVAGPRWRFAVPAVFGATVIACSVDLPTFVRFDVCRTPMQRTAEAALASGSACPNTVRLGPYGVVDATVDGPAAFFRLDSHGWTDQGLAYSPSGPPAVIGTSTHLHRGWYRYTATAP